MTHRDFPSNRGIFIGAGSGVVLAGATAFVTLTMPGAPLLVLGTGLIGLIGGYFLGSDSHSVEFDSDVLSKLPDDLKKQLDLFLETVDLHRENASPLTKELVVISDEIQKLFSRVLAKLDNQQVRLTAVNYTDSLGKLNRLLAKDYYIDILKNPRLWDSSQKRLNDVDKATVAFEEQIVRNIQQVNASKDLDFQLAIDSVYRSTDKGNNPKEMLGENER